MTELEPAYATISRLQWSYLADAVTKAWRELSESPYADTTGISRPLLECGTRR
jgi:hypothetical protein